MPLVHLGLGVGTQRKPLSNGYGMGSCVSCEKVGSVSGGLLVA